MSKSKKLSGLDASLTSTISQAQGSKEHPTVTEAEAAERRKNGNTRGAKGAKLKRINFAFYDDNYDFIVKYSKFRGQNMTEFVNHIIEEYREQHKEQFEQFEKFVSQT